MVSQRIREFEAELTKLFAARTHALRSTIKVQRGAVPKMTRKRIRQSIGHLQELFEREATRPKQSNEVLYDYDYKKQWHPKRGKGWGRDAKRISFKRWYENNIATDNCVYAFWSNKKCLYVGRTIRGKGRPTQHFEKHWFSKATRLDVYGFGRKRGVPQFECVYTHRHKPAYSKVRPAKKKYYTACYVCVGQETIKDEIKRLFRLK